MELEIKIAGITYQTLIEVEDEFVCGVVRVSVYDGFNYHPLKLSFQELDEFYQANEEILNETYKDHIEALYSEMKENDK